MPLKYYTHYCDSISRGNNETTHKYMINISINTRMGQQGNTVQYPVLRVSLSSHTVKGEKVTWLNKILSSNLKVNLAHPQVRCSHYSDLS
jgi:hypothetical protein